MFAGAVFVCGRLVREDLDSPGLSVWLSNPVPSCRIIIILGMEVKGRCKSVGDPVPIDKGGEAHRPPNDTANRNPASSGGPGFPGTGQATTSGGPSPYSVYAPAGAGLNRMNGHAPGGYGGAGIKADPGGPGMGPKPEMGGYGSGSHQNGAGPPSAVSSLGNTYGGGGYGGNGSAYGAPGGGAYGQGVSYSNGYGPPVSYRPPFIRLYQIQRLCMQCNL